MDSTFWFAAWIVAVVAAIALLSWALARHQRSQALRGVQARCLLAALQRYSTWVGAQRLAAVFHGEPPDAAQALDEACTLRRDWFPELAGEMAQLLAVHKKILDFLGAQQALWLRDPEHWLRSGHDEHFVALWRQHRLALQALQARLEQAASVKTQPAAQPRRSTYA